MKNELGNIDNSRTDEQRTHMENTVGKGVCPFCPEGFNPKLNQAIWKDEYRHWKCWKNPFPYTGHKTHIVIVHAQHIGIEAVSEDSWKEWGLLNQRLIRELGLPGGGIVMRFGANEFNGATLTHLHSHIQVPDRKTCAIAVFYTDPALQTFLDNQEK